MCQWRHTARDRIALVDRVAGRRYTYAELDMRASRAAAMLQLLLHVPALEHSNAMFASAVAYGYLVASGLKVSTSPEQVRDLARLVKEGKADVRAIAEELRRWSS